MAALPAFFYFVLIWIGSVQLGWHYASDGLAGALGMLAVWQLARVIQNRRGASDAASSEHGQPDLLD